MRLPLLALIAGLTVLALPAQAQQCGNLTRAFSLDLTPGPGGARYGVPVTVNGVTKQFVLSTRDWASRLSLDVVAELKLNARQLNGSVMLASDGTTRNASIVRADLGIGPMKAPGHEMYVMERSGAFDGLFSPDLMQNYDIELDFAGRKLNYFLTDHCPGRVVYWTNSGFTTVEYKGWDNNASQAGITIPVTLDGKQVYAEIDTNSPITTVDADAARSLFNLTPDSQGAIPLGALDNNPAHRMYGWTFKSLQIGGLAISNTRTQVIPDLIGSRDANMLTPDSRVRRHTDEYQPTVRIGMDVLRRLHLYIAANERKIYITPAAGPASAPQAPATPAPSTPQNTPTISGG